MIRRGLSAFSLDTSQNMLKIGRERFRGIFIQGNMLQLPFASNSFGGIWANANLQHVSRLEFANVLNECWRVLQPAGILYFSVKDGKGELYENANYGPNLPRWFTLWQTPALDAILEDTNLEVISSKEISTDREKWLIRYCRKVELSNFASL